MAIFINQHHLTISSIKENLLAIEYCLSYRNEVDNGCLGIPSAILICSIIDTIGSYHRGSNYSFQIDGNEFKIETAEGHFYILNHEVYFNLDLSYVTIQDFYSTYRSKLTHNNSLPPNNFLYFNDEDGLVFHYNNEKKITKINLFTLFQKVKSACESFLHHLENSNFSQDHKVSRELLDKSKINFTDDDNNSSFPPASGVTFL